MTSTMDHERYLSRIGVEPSQVQNHDLSTLERLQQAHSTSIPFETLSITGDPFEAHDGEGVSLAIPELYDKIVERQRGGFCYELNGLFGWLLTECGFDVDRLSARIEANGELGPPADHLTLLVSLDQRYVVDVGLGIPKLRQPLALDGTTHTDAAGVKWRITESDRPDTDYTMQFREPDSTEWTTRCIFRDTPREMYYFEATCEYFEHAPESVFRGDPVVIRATERGHTKLSPTTLTHIVDGDSQKRSISEEEWYELLEREFGVNWVEYGGSLDT
jgi:N-hydroxyarylamine O-acetyltransferase